MSKAEEVGAAAANIQLVQQLQKAQAEVAVKNRTITNMAEKNANLEINLASHQLELERQREINQSLQAQVGALNAEKDGKNPAPLRVVENITGETRPAESGEPPAEAPQS